MTGQKKPNIFFIHGRWHRMDAAEHLSPGADGGWNTNIDRIGHEGAIFMDLAMQSCTSGRNAFFTGMYPLRTGMIPPQLPVSPTYLKPGTPALAKFLLDLSYNTGEFGKNHLGDHHRGPPDSARIPGVLGLSLGVRNADGL
jgi:arylsulfatase A-like enzyme